MSESNNKDVYPDLHIANRLTSCDDGVRRVAGGWKTSVRRAQRVRWVTRIGLIRKQCTCKLCWCCLGHERHCTHTISLSQLVTILGWVGATVYVLFVAPVGGTASAAAVVLIDDAEQP